MEEIPSEWQFNGRIEFHLNDGRTKVSAWHGGYALFDLSTDSIPAHLRGIGTWVKLRLSLKDGLSVIGSGESEEWPWKTQLP